MDDNNSKYFKYKFADFYPGDAYFDWIGADRYDSKNASSRGFVNLLNSFFNDFGTNPIIDTKVKPLMICETGEFNNSTDGFTQEKYFNDAMTALKPGGAFNPNPTLTKSPRISAMGYFNTDGTSGAWSIESPTIDFGGQQAWSTMMKDTFFQ